MYVGEDDDGDGTFILILHFHRFFSAVGIIKLISNKLY